MRNRVAGVVLVSALLLLVGASPASALTKVRSPLALTTNPVELEGFCPFPITYQDISGSGITTLVFDAEGNLVRIDIHPHGVFSRFSANGNTVVANNSGPVSVFPQPDGTDLVILRGRSFAADRRRDHRRAFLRAHGGSCGRRIAVQPADGLQRLLELRPGRERHRPL